MCVVAQWYLDELSDAARTLRSPIESLVQSTRPSVEPHVSEWLLASLWDFVVFGELRCSVLA